MRSAAFTALSMTFIRLLLGMAMGMVEPLAFGMAAMAASTFCDSCAGSAPMRLMMADRLFSDASSMALSK